MAGEQETLQKQLLEALEGKQREKEARLRAEEMEKKMEDELKLRENVEVELKRKLAQKNFELRMLSTGFLEEGNIKLEVEADKVGEDFIFSPYKVIAGLHFRLGCKKEMREDMRGPTFLFCNDTATIKAWSALVACSFTLHSSISPAVASYFTLFGPSVTSQGTYKYPYYWDSLVKPSKGYLQHGRFTVEAQIKVIWCCTNSFIDFASSDPQLSDVTLFVGGKTFHVNRMYLAHYCEYFKALFCSDFSEKDKKEIKLDEIDASEFEEMLEVIYPQRKKPSTATVTGLLHMADFFDVPVVRVECTEYLLSSTDFSFTAKLLITEEFRLYELQYRLLESLKTAKEVKTVIDSADFGNLSVTLQKSIYEKHFKLTG